MERIKIGLEILRYTLPLGVISSVFWGKAFGYELTAATVFGIILGFILAILLLVYFLLGSARGAVTQKEAIFAVGSHVGCLAYILIGGGILAWIIRLIFF